MSVANMILIGRYRLLALLGRGGMGRVWLARDDMLGREVAVKEVVLPEELTDEEHEDLLRRTIREARAAARLSHPNVVQIYDVLHAEGRPWIVMEYVRARSLQEMIKEDGPLPVASVAQLGLAVLAALGAAHRAGVLHRDVKPGNVLIDTCGRVVLTDFGLATFDGGEGAATRAGLVHGSPQYISPERAHDGASSPESDLWSLGATLYAAAEGRAPYARTTTMATLTALATMPPDPVQRAGKLEPVLDGLLRKDPQARLPAAEAERMLRRIATGEVDPGRHRPAKVPARPIDTGPATPSPARQRSRRRLWAAGCLTLVLVILVSVLVFGTRQRDGVAEYRTGDLRSPTPGESLFLAGPVPGQSDRYALPEGWFWHHDVTGFRIAAPNGWTASRTDSTVYFREPGGARALRIDRWTPQDPDLVGTLTRIEAQRGAAHQLPGYQRLRIETQPHYFQSCAAWEYTYDGTGADRLHAIEWRFTTSPTQGYTVAWLTRTFDWQVNLANFWLVIASFRPAG